MDYCPFCEAAKRLLKARGVPFEEVHVDEDDDAAWENLFKRSGMRTMPQIWAGSRLIGGYTELKALDDAQGLSSLGSKKES